MDKKKQIHEDIMSFLSDYLTNTPEDIIRQEIAEMNRKTFIGTSAQNYFINFHTRYLNLENQLSSNSFIENHTPVQKITQRFKSAFTMFFVDGTQKLFYTRNKHTLEQKFSSNDFNTFSEVNTIKNIQRNKYEYV